MSPRAPRPSGPPAPDASAAPPARRSLVDSAEEALRNWLSPGRHRAGDRLPPEHDLASMLGVSRGTLRTALNRLAETGEIVRRQGSGTFVGSVAQPGFREGLERLESYASLARSRGVRLSARDLRIGPVPVEAGVAGALGIAAGTAATRISRVVVAGERPFALMVDTVHPDVALPPPARLRRAIDRGDMVLDVLLAEGVPVAYTTTAIEARLLTARQQEGKALGVQGSTAVLEMQEIYHATSGAVTHHSRDVFAPEGLDLRVVRWMESHGPLQVGDEHRAGRRGAA